MVVHVFIALRAPDAEICERSIHLGIVQVVCERDHTETMRGQRIFGSLDAITTDHRHCGVVARVLRAKKILNMF